MPPKVRIRERPNIELSSFDAGFNFSSRRARYDKVDFSVDLGELQVPDTIAVHALFGRIARRSDKFRNDGSEGFPALTIRKGRGWIFGGEIKITPSRNRGRPKVRAHLSLNVSRYFANNPPSRPAQRGRWFYNAEYYGPGCVEASHQSIDGNDNLVVEERLAEALDADWSQLLESLVGDAASAIENEISHFDRDDLILFSSRLRNWTLRALEVYWEFRTPNASLTAETFAEHVALHFRRHRKRIYLSEYDYDGANVSYIFETTRKNVNVAIYAKTADRIRVECRFSRYLKQILNEEGDTYPNDSMSHLSGFLEAIIRKAQTGVAPLKDARETYHARTSIKKRTLVGTLAALSHMAGEDQMLLQRVIQNLTISKRLSKTGDTRYNDVIDRMEQRGLLKAYRKRSRQPLEYAPTTELKKIISIIS